MFCVIQYNTIQCNTIQCNTIQYNAIQHNTIQYNTIQYNIIWLRCLINPGFSLTFSPFYDTIQYNTIQYNTIQYNTIQYPKKQPKKCNFSKFPPKFRHQSPKKIILRGPINLWFSLTFSPFHDTIQYNTIQYDTIQYISIQYCTTNQSIMQYNLIAWSD